MKVWLLGVAMLAGCGRRGFERLGTHAADARELDGGLDAPADAAQLYNYVFATSSKHTGDLGGLAGADAICQTRASAAGLGGTYVAWLSTSTVDAISRLGAARGWVRPDGRPVFDTQADLLAGHVLYPPRLDETGADLLRASVTTGTGRDGRRSTGGTTCGDWTVANTGLVAIGEDSVASGGFTLTGINATCDTPRSFYCFGVDRARPVVVGAPTTRTAFLAVTGMGITGAVTLTGADAQCASLASSAGLAGTYKALLATSTASAASRFDTTGPPWARTDGVLLADTAAALFAAPYWNTGLSVDAFGSGFLANTGVWTGAATPLVAGTLASTCTNWSTTAGNGVNGTTDDSDASRAFAFGSTTCAQTYGLFCLQL